MKLVARKSVGCRLAPRSAIARTPAARGAVARKPVGYKPAARKVAARPATLAMTVACLAALVVTVLLAAPAHAQGNIADYQRAMGLRERFSDLVVDVAETPVWIEGTNRFWYRKSVAGGNAFVMVDAATQEQGPAFDHERLAAALSAAVPAAAGEQYTAVTLPFRSFELVGGGDAIEFSIEGDVWRCGLAAYDCRDTGRQGGGRGGRGGFGGGGRGGFGGGRGGQEPQPIPSPDGNWEALIDNHNVVVRHPGADELVRLSLDGSEGSHYELGSIAWSPDSTKLAAYRVTPPPFQRQVHYVESSPADQLQPKYSSRNYTKPGDVLEVERPVLFDVATRRRTIIDSELFPNAYSMSRLEWRDDARAFTFEYNQRGHQVYRVIEVDADSGAARAVISEEPETFFNYRTISGRQSDSGKKFRYDLNDGARIIWMSERDGWNHLYMYDGVTGEVDHQITKGEWVVRGIEKVDEEKQQIWFTASGMYPGKDPYFIHYYRIDFDGTGLTALTEADANHSAVFSEDMQYLVDTYSRVDLAPVVELRRASDGTLLKELEHGDISALTAAGWKPPEVFVAKGRDGSTDIWGVIFRPTDFDPSRTYPVVENIYAGPQGSFVPNSFQEFNGMRSIAELGFIVVQMDGMGTSNRSKAFHDVAWQDLGDAGFPDRILWHQAVAARYPYYDITRVGIYGTSAGGQSSLGGLLFHPEFYDVAVSASGCHDNRMDKIWWNEQWMGWPIDEHYAASSNVDNAWRLEGNVLLIVGEMDTNVDPASTLQVVDAFIKADKDFDLLFIPGAGHTSGGAFGEHKRYDYFVQHLLGVTPPRWADLAAAMTDDDAGQRQVVQGEEEEAAWNEDFSSWVEEEGR